MKLKPGVWFGCAATIVLTGCTAPYTVERVDMMDAGEDTFLAYLHAGYVELAHKEAAFYDHVDAVSFLDKAAAAAAGQTVLPWDPREWRIDSAETMATMTAERAVLLAELDSGDRAELPETAARAQTMFDCWVEEAEEGPLHNGPIAAHQDAMIAQCRDAFLTALEELLYVPPEPVVEEPQTEFTIYFSWNRSELSEFAGGFLDAVVDEAMRQGPSSITVVGHADTSGTDDFNDELSEARARETAAYLAAAGVDDSIISVEWHGETLLAVDTGDGVRNPGNRRVEIIFE